MRIEGDMFILFFGWSGVHMIFFKLYAKMKDFFVLSFNIPVAMCSGCGFNVTSLKELSSHIIQIGNASTTANDSLSNSGKLSLSSSFSSFECKDSEIEEHTGNHLGTVEPYHYEPFAHHSSVG